MNEQRQKKQVELSVTIDQQYIPHYVVETLGSEQVPAFVGQSKTMNRNTDIQWKQLWGEQIQQGPAFVQPAAQQVQQPVAAPQKESYKERKERESKEKKLLKEGKKYTPNANLQTARLMQLKEQADAEAANNPVNLSEELEETQLNEIVTRISEASISPDMFSEERFPEESVNLRRTLSDYKNLETLMDHNQFYFEELRHNDRMRYKKLQYCMQMASHLEDMLKIATATYGVSLEGGAINEAPIVEHAKNVRADALRDYSRWLSSMDYRYKDDLEQYIRRRVNEEIPKYNERREQFQRQYIEDNPGAAWMNVPAFNYPPQYESLEKLRGLMQEKGEVYLQHKAMLDTMMEEVTHSLEAYASLKAQTSVYDEVLSHMQTDEKNTLDSKKIALEMTKRMDKLMTDSYAVIERFENVNDAMKMLLRGERLSGLNVVVLSQFGYDAQPQFKQRILDDASANGIRTNRQNAELARLLEDPRVQVGDHSSQFVKRAASMLRQGDDDYNIALLNHLEKVKNLGDNVPDKAFYDQTKALLQPYVDKVMQWDMDKALSMSDDELANYQQTLDALFCDNMFVADLMKTKHWDMGKYSMKNEMLGDRIYDYANRVSTLRALAEKSRGIALQRAAKLGDLPREAFSDFEWINKIHDASGVAAFCNDRKEIGQRMLDAQIAKNADQQQVDSPAFKAKCQEQVRTAVASNFFVAGQFIEIEDSFKNALKKKNAGEPLSEDERIMAEAMDRVQTNRYKLAGYTAEEAARDGVQADIGEPVFRSFTRFTEGEAGRQLTPEQFKQLVLDFGAGYGMEQGKTAPQELEAARQKNMRAARQYKEVMRAQYDFLAKKYGSALENFDAKYISEHLMEIYRDFNNGQVDTDLAGNIPGFYDENDPADMLLMHRANYYNVMGNALVGLMSVYGNGQCTAEELKMMIENQKNTPQIAPHREFLLANKGQGTFENKLKPDAVMDKVKIVD